MLFINNYFGITLVASVWLSLACAEVGKPRQMASPRKTTKSLPLIVDLGKLPGTYTVVGFQGRNNLNQLISTYQPRLLPSHQEAWRIEGAALDVFESAPYATLCGERSYWLDGDSTLVTAATAACIEQRVEVIEQDDSRLTIVREPFTYQGLTFNRVLLSKKSSSQLSREIFQWDTDFALAPKWLVDQLTKEASEVDITSARSDFRKADIVGATLHLKGDFTSVWVKKSATLHKLLFRDGKHSAGTNYAEGNAECDLIVPSPLVAAYSQGFAFRVAYLEVSHSRRERGSWRLERNVETEAVNHDRRNTVKFGLENAPEGVDLTCTQTPGNRVMTVDDVKVAFGSLVQFNR